MNELEVEPQLLPVNKRIGTVPASWPTLGKVEFHSVSARYHPDGPDVLRNISFVANPGERVGIVGRTGSGKSTLGLSLLRFVNLTSGHITIDGLDISHIRLHRLRTSVTLIPQEPLLFSGDVQSNLAPFGEASETELHSALSACTSIHGGPAEPTGNNNKPTRALTLDTPVAVNGENFSQEPETCPQYRARGLPPLQGRGCWTRRPRPWTTRRTCTCSDCYGVCSPNRRSSPIAHRLRTIMDYDRVLVMAEGEIIENDSPANLIKEQGVFWSTLKNTGEYDELVQMVRE